MDLHALNLPASYSYAAPTSGCLPSDFTLSAPYPSDIWRKPPSHNAFTAPIIYHKLPIHAFKSARVSVAGGWKALYDQGGLVVALPNTKSEPNGARRWIKSGIEHYGNRPRMSVVAAEKWADWSLCELGEEEGKEGRVTVEFERLRKEVGEEAEGGSIWSSVLRVSMVGEDGLNTPVREITWAFHDVDEGGEIWVGVYAAKPTKDERDVLEVRFNRFIVEKRDE